MVQNLSQLKKALANGAEFEIIEHYLKPEHSGEVRMASVIQTNGMYSVVTNGKNESVVNEANDGKGFWIGFEKASQWAFDGEDITFCLRSGRPVWKIRLLEN